jgi:uncharacterized protein YebE (UPF0316 family)
MENIFTVDSFLAALLIFSLRIIDMSLDTLRVLFVMRGRKAFAWVLGFFQAMVFVLAISSVLSNLENPLSVIGYAAGFATGNVLGMLIEERLAIGHILISIISPRRGAVIAEEMREEGFAVTEIPARGRDGMVTMLSCSVLRRNVKRVRALVQELDPEAFITSEEIRPVRRGFWRA